MSSEQKLQRLESILKFEFDALALGQFQRLGELLCEKLHILETLDQQTLDPNLLKRCWRLNKELVLSLRGHEQKKKVYRRTT